MGEQMVGNTRAVGAVRSEEFRKRVGDLSRGSHRGLGTPKKEETKRRISEGHKGMKKPWARETIKENRRKIRSVSSLERKVAAFLRSVPVRFEQQFRFKIASGEDRYADFYLPDFNLIIECDGKHWHDEMPDRLENDRLKEAAWARMGLRVLRLPEEKIKKHFEECALLLLQYLR